LGLLADCSPKIAYAQEAGEAQKTGGVLSLSSTEISHLPDLDKGEVLWRIGERSFMVRHISTPGEVALFDANARMVASSNGGIGRPQSAHDTTSSGMTLGE
jgi:hypothetical protein